MSAKEQARVHQNLARARVSCGVSSQRETLIPPGKPVPAVAQFWSSDPRPRLTLYRGPSTPDGKEHFLGQFEVMDLPSSANLKVSTLCVVANGQIILCARDNNRDLFLDIRRVDSEAVK